MHTDSAFLQMPSCSSFPDIKLSFVPFVLLSFIFLFLMYVFKIHHLTDCAERYHSLDVERSMFDVGRSSLRVSRAVIFVV